jgi:hypothetical protein
MAKPTTQDRGQRPGFSFDTLPGLDPASFAANLEPFFQAGTKALDTWRVVSEELLEFGKARLTRNMEMSRKVTQSPSLDKAFEAHADFARSLMEDYIAETGKLAELGTRAMAETFSYWKSESVRTHAGRDTRRLESDAEETAKHSLAAE